MNKCRNDVFEFFFPQGVVLSNVWQSCHKYDQKACGTLSLCRGPTTACSSVHTTFTLEAQSLSSRGKAKAELKLEQKTQCEAEGPSHNNHANIIKFMKGYFHAGLNHQPQTRSHPGLWVLQIEFCSWEFSTFYFEEVDWIHLHRPI